MTRRLLDAAGYWLDELFPLPVLALVVGCGVWATWGLGMNGEGMEQVNIMVAPGQEPQPVHCPVCGEEADGFEYEPGYAVSPYRGSNEVFLGPMDEIPERAKSGFDPQIESAPNFARLTLKPCGHVVPAWERARVYRELVTASAQVSVNARAERQERATERIHAALVEASVDGADLRQVAEVAAQAVTR